MDIHYNAFISYRHHPEDIRVASEIHRSLERYKVPKAIRKKSKGITRLFRDKEELPITSNLSTDITQALRNSDYLIVICSVHTRESTWVQREIETFLQTHDRSKVLTVLVNGEPYETIPEILLSEDKVDPVTGQVEKVPIEPLSCDWRMPRRKARREELPRLAAALLGCGYNELRQRERQYRMQRMVAAFSVALTISLCFTAYFIYTSLKIRRANEQLYAANQRIQENLEQALENQSLFLANESSQLLGDGDRLTAMALAMEALPDYEGQRPYVPAAEMALAEALGAYDSEGAIAAVGAMDCSVLINKFLVTEDGKTLYILDARNVITVWDVETFRQVGSLSLSFSPMQIRTTGDGNLLAYEDVGQIACCGRDGTLLWSRGDCDDIAIQEDGNILFVLNYNYEMAGINTPFQCVLTFLDADTGEEVRQPVEFSNPGGNTGIPRFLGDVWPTGLPVCFGFYRSSGVLTDKSYDIVSVDWQSGECTYLTTLTDSEIENAGYTAAGDLLVMCTTSGNPQRGTFLNMLTTGEAIGVLYCLDSETGELLWEMETVSYMLNMYSVLQTIPGSTDLLLLYDNVFHVIDSVTGQILARCEASGMPIWVNAQQTQAQVILDDGSCGAFDYEDSSCSTIKYMEDQLTGAQRVDNLYFAREGLSTQVTVYTWLTDPNCQRYEGDCEYLSGDGFDASQGLMAFESYGDIYVLDSKAKKVLWTNADDADYYSHVQLLGFSEDGNTLWGLNDGLIPHELVAYDADSGTCSATELPDELSGEILDYNKQYVMCGNQLYCVAESLTSDRQFLLRMDAESRAVEYWTVCEAAQTDMGYSQKSVLLAAADTHALVWENSTGTVYEIDTVSGTVSAIAEGVDSRPVAEVYSDTQFVLAVNNEIQIRSFAAEAELVIDLGDKAASAVCVHEEQIFVICDDGELYRYDMSGVQLSCTQLTLYTTFYSDIADGSSEVRWFFTDDGDLIIDACGLGNVVDCGTWQLRAYIPSFVAYDPVTDAMLVNSSLSAASGLCYYPRYTTEDIIAMAQEALNGFELTDEQRAAYGLLGEE